MWREELRWDFRGVGVVDESWMTYDALVDWDWVGGVGGRSDGGMSRCITP